MITKKYYKLVRVSYEDSSNLYFKNISNTVGNFRVVKYGSPYNPPSIEYSIDGVTWTAYDFTNLPTVSVPVGGNIYLKGSVGNTKINESYDRYYKFTMDVDHNVGGNLTTLVPNATNIGNYCFGHLFDGDTHLISAENLYFSNNSKIEGTQYLFAGCTSLITPPDFSVYTQIGNEGCSYMFEYCSITQAPDMSNITTVGNFGCNSMFHGCGSMTKGADLSNVTNLSTTAPFQATYDACSYLTEATAPNISEWNTSWFSGWLNNAGFLASGTKTLYKPSALTIPTGSNSGVPSGWTVENY